MVALHFREWVHVSMIALLVSGAILTFDRLTEPTVSALYIGTSGGEDRHSILALRHRHGYLSQAAY